MKGREQFNGCSPLQERYPRKKCSWSYWSAALAIGTGHLSSEMLDYDTFFVKGHTFSRSSRILLPCFKQKHRSRKKCLIDEGDSNFQERSFDNELFQRSDSIGDANDTNSMWSLSEHALYLPTRIRGGDESFGYGTRDIQASTRGEHAVPSSSKYTLSVAASNSHDASSINTKRVRNTSNYQRNNRDSLAGAGETGILRPGPKRRVGVNQSYPRRTYAHYGGRAQQSTNPNLLDDEVSDNSIPPFKASSSYGKEASMDDEPPKPSNPFQSAIDWIREGNFPKVQVRVEPNTTLKLRKRFRPLKTVVMLGADFNTQLGVWQFKSSWEDSIIGGRLTLSGRTLQLSKTWLLSVGAMDDLVTRLRFRASVDMGTGRAYARFGFRTERFSPINVVEGFTLVKQLPLDGNRGNVKLEVKANFALPEPEIEYSTENHRSVVGMGDIEVNIDELNLLLDY